MKKNKKANKKRNLLVRMLIWLIRYAGLFIIGLVAIIYRIISWFDTKVARTFLKLKRPIKVAIIYTLVILAGYGIYGMNKKELAPVVKEEVLEINFVDGDSKILANNNKMLKAELERVKSQLQKEKTIKSFNKTERDIYNKAVSKYMTHEQAVMLVAISKQETGSWKSKAFNNKNNFGGVMCRDGLRVYSSYNDGLDHFVSLLKTRYFDKGLNSIEQIGAVYCPVGASNDPNGVNKYWIPNVTKFYNEYLNK